MATIKVCDVCGKPADITKHLTIGREMDAAGSMADVHESFDLCWKHLALISWEAFRLWDSDDQEYHPERTFVELAKMKQAQARSVKIRPASE